MAARGNISYAPSKPVPEASMSTQNSGPTPPIPSPPVGQVFPYNAPAP